MKNKWKELRVVALLCIVIGWWGLWFPELETIADTYAIVMEDGTVQKASEVVEYELNGYSCLELLQVDSSQIRVSSKLWKMLKEYF